MLMTIYANLGGWLWLVIRDVSEGWCYYELLIPT